MEILDPRFKNTSIERFPLKSKNFFALQDRMNKDFFEISFPSLSEPLTRGGTTRSATEDSPILSANQICPITPAHVPSRLAAPLAPLPLPVAAASPALVAADTADVEEAEPQSPERPQLPTQDVQFTTDDILHTYELSDCSTDTTCENSV